MSCVNKRCLYKAMCNNAHSPLALSHTARARWSVQFTLQSLFQSQSRSRFSKRLGLSQRGTALDANVLSTKLNAQGREPRPRVALCVRSSQEQRESRETRRTLSRVECKSVVGGRGQRVPLYSQAPSGFDNMQNMTSSQQDKKTLHPTTLLGELGPRLVCPVLTG